MKVLERTQTTTATASQTFISTRQNSIKFIRVV